MIRRTLHEWDKLPYGSDPDNIETIPEYIADRLAVVAEASTLSRRGGGGILDHGRLALGARGIVGVLTADGCSLEILPKIDRPTNVDGETSVGFARKRLVHMLAVALDLKIDVGQMTDLGLQRENLLEILIRIFSEKLADAVRQGMPRRYVAHEEDLSTLRGSLDVTRQFTHHAVNPSRIACRFDVLSEDIVLNRIMRAAVIRLSRIARSVGNQRRLRELAFVYADVADIPIPALRWDDVVTDRTNKRWQDLLGLAKLLLKDRFQTTSIGTSNAVSLLFEMNVLFEEYMARLIARAVNGSGFHVSLQGGRLHCLTDAETERRLFQTKPDILIRSEGKVTHIIDTKWKHISSRMDDAKQGVSQSDVYQMMAYSQLYKAPRLTLLYPHHSGLGNSDGIQATHRITGHNTSLETASFDIADRTDIRERLRRLLFPTNGHLPLTVPISQT